MSSKAKVSPGWRVKSEPKYFTVKRMFSLKTSFTNLLPYLFSREKLWVAKATLEAPRTCGFGVLEIKAKTSKYVVNMRKKIPRLRDEAKNIPYYRIFVKPSKIV